MLWIQLHSILCNHMVNVLNLNIKWWLLFTQIHVDCQTLITDMCLVQSKQSLSAPPPKTFIKSNVKACHLHLISALKLAYPASQTIFFLTCTNSKASLLFYTVNTPCTRTGPRDLGRSVVWRLEQLALEHWLGPIGSLSRCLASVRNSKQLQ